MRMDIEGRARLLGDDVNTDYIIASSRKKESLDPDVLKQYLYESIDPSFAASVRPGDILVAGRNFGCGSAMEVAVTVVLAAGIRAVAARSFARTYYRNAINNGLIPIECDTGGILDGAALHAVVAPSGIRLLDRGRGREIACRPLPPIMVEILAAGGLVPYVRAHRDFVTPPPASRPPT
jgi:3-isopropylmalate/(R)-2-methylmalate dehydratase small subunit